MATILLIEDDPLLGAMIREMLELKQHRVTWVRSGVPAKRRLAEGWRPDLILTDIVMPDMDGLETIQFFHSDHPEIPLIAMSAEADTGYLTLASRMGAAAALQKPFTQELLFQTLTKALGGKSTE